MEHCTKACHIAELDVFHSLCTKYCEKREEFEYEVMDARMKCAVMDHNENTQRKQAVVRKAQKGTAGKGEARFKCPFSKQTKDWNVKPILEEKTYKFVEDMTIQLIQSKKESSMKKPEKSYRPIGLPQNIAPIPNPPKQELIRERKEKDEKKAEAQKSRLEFIKMTRENRIQKLDGKKITKTEVRGKMKKHGKRKAITKEQTNAHQMVENEKKKLGRPKGSMNAAGNRKKKRLNFDKSVQNLNMKRKPCNPSSSHTKRQKKHELISTLNIKQFDQLPKRHSQCRLYRVNLYLFIFYANFKSMI